MVYTMTTRQMAFMAGRRTNVELHGVILRQNNGGVWGDHPRYPAALWEDCVGDGDTRLGYWEWVANRIDMSGEDEDD